MASRKPTAWYQQAVKVLRKGHTDPDSMRVITIGKGLSKTEAIRLARRRGFPVGSESTYDPSEGRLRAYNRKGRYADGFDTADGFDLRNVDEWTPAQKGKVTKLYNQVDELTARPHHIYRARKAENLEAVQRASQHRTFPKQLKVAFVPVARPQETPEIKISPRTKRVRIVERNVGRTPIFWEDIGISKLDLVTDPAGATRALVQRIPADTYNIMAGEHEIPRAYGAEALPAAIVKLTLKYNSVEYDPADPNSSYFENWLAGINAYDFPTLVERASHARSKTKESDKLQKQRRLARAKFRREHGSPRRQRRFKR